MTNEELVENASGEFSAFSAWQFGYVSQFMDLARADERAKIESKFSGTHLSSVGSDGGIQIAISCISLEASKLLDKSMEEWEKHFAKRRERNPKDEPSIYGFAYWLIRWSGLVRPSITEVQDGN